MGSNVVEPLRPRILPSVPAPKIAELREGGLVNVGIQIRPIAPSTLILISSCSSQSSRPKLD